MLWMGHMEWKDYLTLIFIPKPGLENRPFLLSWHKRWGSRKYELCLMTCKDTMTFLEGTFFSSRVQAKEYQNHPFTKKSLLHRKLRHLLNGTLVMHENCFEHRTKHTLNLQWAIRGHSRRNSVPSCYPILHPTINPGTCKTHQCQFHWLQNQTLLRERT